jgi:hypothetical protein
MSRTLRLLRANRSSYQSQAQISRQISTLSHLQSSRTRSGPFGPSYVVRSHSVSVSFCVPATSPLLRAQERGAASLQRKVWFGSKDGERRFTVTSSRLRSRTTARFNIDKPKASRAAAHPAASEAIGSQSRSRSRRSQLTFMASHQMSRQFGLCRAWRMHTTPRQNRRAASLVHNGRRASVPDGSVASGPPDYHVNPASYRDRFLPSVCRSSVHSD